jgi:hypothetical protein
MRPVPVLLVTAWLVCLASAMPAVADSCDAFTWNLAHERSLFASTPGRLSAGRDASSAPLVDVDRLYELLLRPDTEVHLPVTPGRKPGGETTSAGILRVRVERAGLYRVSLSEGDWIEVVHDGTALPAGEHQGQHECSAPRKVVQFQLPAGDLFVQLSGSVSATVRLTITPAPSSSDAPAK